MQSDTGAKSGRAVSLTMSAILLGVVATACRSATDLVPQRQVKRTAVVRAIPTGDPTDTLLITKDPALPGRYLMSSSKTGQLLSVTDDHPDSTGFYRVHVLGQSRKVP